MKKIKSAIAVLAVLFASLGVPPKAQANGELDQILANMQNAGSKIKALAANLNQHKKLKAIGGSENYNGTIAIQRGGQNNEKAIVHYTNGQHVSVVGNRIVLYNERIPQAIETTRQSQAKDKPQFDFIATPYKSVAELKAQFNITYLGDENGMAKLELAPKNSALQKSVLWVDRGLWIPTKFKVVENNGDDSYFTLSSVQLNPKITPDTFKIKYAPGTKVIVK